MVRRFTRNDGLIPADIVHCALDHLAAAKLLFESSPILYDSAGYLAHLGVEMLLKAWLLEVLNEFDGTHNLQTLFAKLKDNGKAESLDDRQSAIMCRLDKYEQLRYPNLNSPTEVGEDDWNDIEILVGALCRSMPPEISEAVSEINTSENPGPIRKAGRILMEKKE